MQIADLLKKSRFFIFPRNADASRSPRCGFRTASVVGVWLAAAILAGGYLRPAPLFADDADTIRQTVRAWRAAWENKDFKTYQSFYSPAFKTETMNYRDWMAKKAVLFKTGAPISIEISEPDVHIDGKKAMVVFSQKYNSKNLSDVGRKQL